jgi:hypothetical protein
MQKKQQQKIGKCKLAQELTKIQNLLENFEKITKLK